MNQYPRMRPSQNVGAINQSYGPSPATVTCPHCSTIVKTRTESEPGVAAWALGTILCLSGMNEDS